VLQQWNINRMMMMITYINMISLMTINNGKKLPYYNVLSFISEEGGRHFDVYLSLEVG
jgi:hypothetical protein